MRSSASVYGAKYALRRVLDRVPALARLDPNAVSLSVLVPSALAAVALANEWWVVAAVSIVARMFLATLDGYVAQRYAKESRLGAFVNRATAQVGDAAILLALLARAEPFWVALALAGTWLADGLAFLGVSAGASLQWVGPGAQADRLTVLLAASVLALFVPVPWTAVTQVLVALLAVTIVARVAGATRELRRS